MRLLHGQAEIEKHGHQKEPFAESFTDLKDIAVPLAPRHLSARESARNNVGGGRGMRVVGGGCKQ